MQASAAVLGAALAVGIGFPAGAEPKNGTIQLSEGGQTVITMTRSFSSVSIANPEVADGLPRSDRVLVIVGKKVGTSDIIIFQDAEQLFHATIAVSPPTVIGKVYNHSQKGLSDYKAYQCNASNCVRVDDKYEQKDLIILGGGGPTSIGSSGITVITPPR